MKKVFLIYIIIVFSSTVFSADQWILLSYKNRVTIKDGVKNISPEIGAVLRSSAKIVTNEKSSAKVLLNTGKNTYIFLINANKEVPVSRLRSREYITGNKTTVLSSMLGSLFAKGSRTSIMDRTMLDTYIFPKGKIFQKPPVIVWDIISKAVAYELEVTDIEEGKKKNIIVDPHVMSIEYPKEFTEFGPDSDIFVKLDIKFKDIDDIISKNLVSGPKSIDEWAKVSQVLKNVLQKKIPKEEQAMIFTEFFYNNEYYCESLAWALVLENKKSEYIYQKIEQLCEKLDYNRRKLTLFRDKVAPILRKDQFK